MRICLGFLFVSHVRCAIYRPESVFKIVFDNRRLDERIEKVAKVLDVKKSIINSAFDYCEMSSI